MMAYLEPIIDDSGHEMGFVAKGHITAQEMQAAIRYYWHDDFEIERYKIRHTRMRKVPVQPNQHFSPYWSFQYVEAGKPGPGAYECTVLYFD